MLFSGLYPRYSARNLLSASACALNPAAITVEVVGLENSFAQPYRAYRVSSEYGEPWSTTWLAKTISNPDGVPLIPHPSSPLEHAYGVLTYDGEDPTALDLRYGGRGFAVLGRAEPSIRALALGGSNAEITLQTASVSDPNDGTLTSHWEVTSISVTANKGSGYSDFGEISVVANQGSVCASAASARMRTGRAAPTLSVDVQNVSPCDCKFPNATAGAGVDFRINYQPRGTSPPTWEVASIDVLAGGEGYTNGVPLVFTPGLHDTIESSPSASVTVAAGSVTGVTLAARGIIYKSGVPTGKVESLVKGAYYKEDASLPAYFYADALAGNGLTVDTNVASETFGRITAADPGVRPPLELKVESLCENACLAELNGTLVLAADDIEVIGNPGYAARHRAVHLCLSSPIGSGASLFVVPPAGYDNKAVGITAVAVEINKSGVLMSGSGYAELGRVEPTYTLSATPGTGATFDYKLRQETDLIGRPYWMLTEATVSGGTGYRDNTIIAITHGPGAETSPSLRLRTRRSEPTLTVTPCPGGTGAVFKLFFAKSAGDTPTWSIAEVSIINGGSGYQGEVPLSFSVTFPSVRVRDACAIAQAAPDGSLQSVKILNEGEYFLDTTVPERVQIIGGGPLFALSSDVPVFAPPVHVAVTQNWPFSNGSGASIEAVVDTSPTSPTFGKITGGTVAASGSGYVLWCAGLPANEFHFTSDTHLLNLPRSSTRVEGDADSVCMYQLHCNAATAVPTTSLGIIESAPEVTLSVHLTGPDKDGIRHATALFFSIGYGVEDGFKLVSPHPGFYCARAFHGSASGDEITLTPLDGGPGTVTVFLYGNPAERTNICSCCDLRDVNCDPPKLFIEGTGQQFVDIEQPSLPFAQCIDENNVVVDGAWVQLAPVYAEDGSFLQWVVVCGECPEGSEVLEPFAEPPQPRQKTWCRCDDTFEKFCYWKATFDAGVTPDPLNNVDCTTGVELDFSECDNPLP